jgi:integrase/recombinase XerD
MQQGRFVSIRRCSRQRQEIRDGPLLASNTGSILASAEAFSRWLHEQGEIPALVKLRPQRLEKRIIDTHDEAALRAILTYRPKTFPHRRVHALASTILDTGCRIEEMLTVCVTDFDFDNLLLTVYGKGRKERRVPFSTELRKVLFRFGSGKSRSGSG